MSSLAPVDPPLTARVVAAPGLLLSLSSSAVLQMRIPLTEATPVNAPLEGQQRGSLFRDRSDPNLWWYVPIYSLAADPDPAFAFSATRIGHDDKGNPFFAGRLRLSLAKSLPPDALDVGTQTPAARVQEIVASGLSATLATSYKDESGNDQFRMQAGTIVTAPDGTLTLTFDNILGGAVVSLYEALVMFSGASVVLSGTYALWRQVLRPPRAIPPRGRLPFDPDVRPIPAPAPTRTVMLHPMMAAASFRSAAMMRPLPIDALRAIDVPDAVVPIDRPEVPQTDFQRIATPLQFKFDLARKYAATQYSLQYTLTDATSTRPIIDVDDLRDFNVHQSEFKPLTALGDISQRYPSLNRAYVGVLSKTIIVIPTRYSIGRGPGTLDCECLALVDSSASGGSRCKFQFSFLITPDVSAIDLLQFSREVSAAPNLQGFTVKLPDLLKEGATPKLQTAFQSSVDCVKTNIPNAFSLAIQVKDDDNGSPAVANANLLIRQLCVDQQPFLAGSLALKLDDFYPDPVEATVVLNLHDSVGSADELSCVLDPATQTVDVVNRSAFALHFARYALCTAAAVSVVSTDQLVPSGTIFQAPLPTNSDAVTVLVDRQTGLTGPIAKSDIGPLIAFQTQDVQNTQYMIGVNATPVNFDGRAITQIDVSVVLTDLPEVSVPTFSLVSMRKVNQTNVLIPIQFALSHLDATLKFALHHTDAEQTVTAFTLQHEFIDEPILLLDDAALNAAT